MTGLVNRQPVLFLRLHDPALAFEPDSLAFDGFVEVRHADEFLVMPSREQRGFIDEVG